MMHRRQVLLGIGVAGLGAAVAPWLLRGEQASTATPLFFSAFDDDQGQHNLAVMDANARLIFKQPVPERAHSVSLSPDGQQVIFFARRPGRMAWQIDLQDLRLVRTLHADAGRHFYGHGCFSCDGRRLYTSENDYENARGVITERELATGNILAEFDSGGIGPHDLRLAADGSTLIVANGGLHTHPEQGRDPLNLESMQPNLAYVDRRNGSVLERINPPHHQLSMRHLWVTPGPDNQVDEVAVVMQYQGPVTDTVPLVAFHRRGQALRTAIAPLATQRQMQAYTASVCMHPESGIALVTCPHGGLVTLWDVPSAKFIKSLSMPDAGGVNLSGDGQGFLVSTGQGQVNRVSITGQRQIVANTGNTHWDNHLVSVNG